MFCQFVYNYSSTPLFYSFLLQQGEQHLLPGLVKKSQIRKFYIIFRPSVDRWEKRIIMNATEQSMIEARERSVAPFSDAAGTAGAKGFTAEGYPFSRTDMPGPV